MDAVLRPPQPDGGTVQLCDWCGGLIERTPTIRERQYAAGTLYWQEPVRQNIEPDISFASAIASDLAA